jgi:hypothetical protein
MFCVNYIQLDACKDKGLNLLAKFFQNFLTSYQYSLVACIFPVCVDSTGL